MSRTLRTQFWIVAGAAVLVLLILFVPVQRTVGGDEPITYACPSLTGAVFDDAPAGGVPGELWDASFQRLPSAAKAAEIDERYVIHFQWQLDNLRATCGAERQGRLGLLVVTCTAALIAVMLVGQARREP